PFAPPRWFPGGRGAGSVEVAPAPDGGLACRRFGVASGKSSLQVADAPDEVARRPLGLDDFLLERAARLGVASRARRARLALDPGQQVAQLVLDGVDVLLEARERPLDLLDRAVLRHHPLDCVDAPDDERRVEPARPAVLALAADAHRAGQEAELHVLAQR